MLSKSFDFDCRLHVNEQFISSSMRLGMLACIIIGHACPSMHVDVTESVNKALMCVPSLLTLIIGCV